MGQKLYQVVFGGAVFSGAVTGISWASGIDINPVSIAINAGDMMIKAINDAFPSAQPNNQWLTDTFNRIKWWIELADTISFFIPLIIAMFYSIWVVLSFIMAFVGAVALFYGVFKNISGLIWLGIILLVIAEIIVLVTPDRRQNSGSSNGGSSNYLWR